MAKKSKSGASDADGGTANSPLVGKWRIIEIDLWDSDSLDLIEPAYISITRRGLGKFVFGMVTGGLDCRHTPGGVEFTWQGHYENDAVCGSGWAELGEDGTLTGEIRFHLGEEVRFKARRW